MPNTPEIYDADRLDVLVAEYIFGWHCGHPRVRLDINPLSSFTRPRYPGDPLCTARCVVCGDCVGNQGFSKTIDAAWEVVENMEAAGWEFALEIRDGGYHCTFSGNPRQRWVATASRDSAPRAICAAALKALMCENPNLDLQTELDSL